MIMRLTTTQWIVNIGDDILACEESISFRYTSNKERKEKTRDATVGHSAVGTLIDQNNKKWRKESKRSKLKGMQ